MESTIASAPENVFVPSVLLSNVMSLAPKIDEIQHCVVHANFGLVCLTETWLKDCIQDEVVSISGFNIVRLDRKSQIHGGVCTYINESIQFSIMDDLVDPAFEVLWIKIRPSRLPRGFNCIIVGTVYHPPSASDSEMLNYLINCLSSIEAQSPNSGILLLEDFNKLKVTKLKSSFKLKQIITFPTRGSNTLDLILTNLHEFYNSPVQRPPFGLSDHMTIDLQPKTRSQQPKQRLTIKSRDLRPSNRLAMHTYFQEIDVAAVVKTKDTCAEKLEIFQSILKNGLDQVVPLRTRTIHLNEPPWINSTLKKLIKQRQRALSQGNLIEFRRLRNRVNRERKVCRSKYYEAKVEHLKDCKPAKWWKEIKKLSGMSSASGRQNDVMNSLRFIEEVSSTSDLANIVNDAFILPMKIFSPLPHDFQLEQDIPSSAPFVLSVHSVFMKLSLLNPTKAQGPDGLPAWLLK